MAEERRERKRISKSKAFEAGLTIGRGASRGTTDLVQTITLSMLGSLPAEKRPQVLQEWYHEWQSNVAKTAPSDWKRFIERPLRAIRAAIPEIQEQLRNAKTESEKAQFQQWLDRHRTALQEWEQAVKQFQPQSKRAASVAGRTQPAPTPQTFHQMLTQKQPSQSPPTELQAKQGTTGAQPMAQESPKKPTSGKGRMWTPDKEIAAKVAASLQSQQGRQAAPPQAQPTQPASQQQPAAAGATTGKATQSGATGTGQPQTQQPPTTSAPPAATKAGSRQPSTPIGKRPGPTYGRPLTKAKLLSPTAPGGPAKPVVLLPTGGPTKPAGPATTRGPAPKTVSMGPGAPTVTAGPAKPGGPMRPRGPAGSAKPTPGPGGTTPPAPSRWGKAGKVLGGLLIAGLIIQQLRNWLTSDQNQTPPQVPLPPPEDPQRELARQAAIQNIYEDLLRTGTMYFPPPPYTLSGWPDMYPPKNAAPGWPGLYPPVAYGPEPLPQFYAPDQDFGF